MSILFSMITATLQEAKAKLHQLVEAAQAGQQVVLLRGSEIVARILPLSAEELEISPQLTDRQAENFWKEVHKKPVKKFSSTKKAIHFLKKQHVLT